MQARQPKQKGRAPKRGRADLTEPLQRTRAKAAPRREHESHPHGPAKRPSRAKQSKAIEPGKLRGRRRAQGS